MKIYLIGFMGSGKSHWGQRLGKKLKLPFFDLDAEIEKQTNTTVNHFFTENGEEGFRQLEKEILHRISDNNERFVMACGGGTPCYFNNIEYLNQQGTTVWIDTDVNILYGRLKKGREHRPLIKDTTDEELREYIIQKMEDRKIYYEQAHIRIQDNSTTALNDVIRQIIDPTN